jgi:hypothetical protein
MILGKENIQVLIDELCCKYNLESFEIRDIIKTAIIKTYNFINVSISEDGYLLGLKNNDTSYYEIQYYNMSKKKYNQFKELLEKQLLSYSLEKIKKYFFSIVKTNHNILYARPARITKEQVEFKFFNRNQKEIKNFYALLDIRSENFFGNEFKQELFKYEDEGFLFYIPKREKIIQDNGRFRVKIIRVHEQIIRHKINSIFNKLKNLGNTYGYTKCIIDLKRRRITLFINMFFSKKIQDFFKEELQEIDNFEIVYINSKKKVS